MIKYFPERIHVKGGEGLGNVEENVIPGFRALFLLRYRSQILACVSLQEKETSDKWPLYLHSTTFTLALLLTVPSSTTPHTSIQLQFSHFHTAPLLTGPSSTTSHKFHPAPLLTSSI